MRTFPRLSSEDHVSPLNSPYHPWADLIPVTGPIEWRLHTFSTAGRKGDQRRHQSEHGCFLSPTLQKSEGFRVKASEGEVVVLYFEAPATQNLKSSGFPEG